MTTFFCLEHGLNDWSQKGKIQGQTELELIELGKKQVHQWAEALYSENFDCLLTSPSPSALQTASLLHERMSHLPLFQDPRLIDMDWGQWTGMTEQELKSIRPEVKKQEKKGFGFCPPRGESREALLLRVCDAFLDFSEAHPVANVLVITHSGGLQCLGYALSGLEFLPHEKSPLEAFHLHRVECFDNEFALGQINMEL